MKIRQPSSAATSTPAATSGNRQGNPKEFVAESGFYDGASAKVPQILVFKDIAGAEFNPAMTLGER